MTVTLSQKTRDNSRAIKLAKTLFKNPFLCYTNKCWKGVDTHLKDNCIPFPGVRLRPCCCVALFPLYFWF